MDIVFEHNPRKKIPRETMDKWMAERGLRREEEREANIAARKEKEGSIPSIPEKTAVGHDETV